MCIYQTEIPFKYPIDNYCSYNVLDSRERSAGGDAGRAKPLRADAVRGSFSHGGELYYAMRCYTIIYTTLLYHTIHYNTPPRRPAPRRKRPRAPHARAPL